MAASKTAFARLSRRAVIVARLVTRDDADMIRKKAQPRIPRKVFSEPGKDRKRTEVGRARKEQNRKERALEGAKTVALPPTIPQKTIAVEARPVSFNCRRNASE